MRIAYVCYWDLAARDGVARKIDRQARLWREAGHEVEVFAAPPGPRAAGTRAVVRGVEAFRPRVVYLRYDLFLPPLGRVLRRFPSVVEINGNDLVEIRRRTAGKRVYNRWNRRRVYGRAAGLVCVTNELAAALASFGKPFAVIANGADPDEVPWTPAPVHERPRAVFAGSPRLPWHGVDRLLELARALPDVDFDLVGPAAERPPPNVTVHGTLAGAAYWETLARADLAVGSLALERAGLREGSPLKVREYLLAGLPVVIGYEDTDFLGDEPWFLHRLRDAEALRGFVERVRGRRVAREEVESRVSSHVKEQARLAFLEGLLGSG